MPTNQNTIKFSVSPTLEFACALYIMANGRNCLSLSKEIGFEPDQLLIDIGEAGAKIFSRHMQKELSFFMGQEHSGMASTNPLNALPFLAALENPVIEDISELIKYLESSDEGYLPFLMAKNAMGLKSRKEYKLEMLEDYISLLSPEEESFREKLQECLQNFMEMRIRFCLLLRQFYENVYKPFEADINRAVKAKVAYYEQQFAREPSAFTNDYFRIDLNTCEKKPAVYLSLFLQIGSMRFQQGDSSDVIIMGINSDKRFGHEVVKNHLISFYKLLSDAKRFQLMELISESPRYVNELSELLDLAPSTVSHHLSYFVRAGIVVPKRDEHKLYYALDHTKVRILFERSIKMFTNKMFTRSDF